MERGPIQNAVERWLNQQNYNTTLHLQNTSTTTNQTAGPDVSTADGGQWNPVGGLQHTGATTSQAEGNAGNTADSGTQIPMDQLQNTSTATTQTAGLAGKPDDTRNEILMDQLQNASGTAEKTARSVDTSHQVPIHLPHTIATTNQATRPLDTRLWSPMDMLIHAASSSSCSPSHPASQSTPPIQVCRPLPPRDSVVGQEALHKCWEILERLPEPHWSSEPSDDTPETQEPDVRPDLPIVSPISGPSSSANGNQERPENQIPQQMSSSTVSLPPRQVARVPRQGVTVRRQVIPQAGKRPISAFLPYRDAQNNVSRFQYVSRLHNSRRSPSPSLRAAPPVPERINHAEYERMVVAFRRRQAFRIALEQRRALGESTESDEEASSESDGEDTVSAEPDFQSDGYERETEDTVEDEGGVEQDGGEAEEKEDEEKEGFEEEEESDDGESDSDTDYFICASDDDSDD